MRLAPLPLLHVRTVSCTPAEAPPPPPVAPEPEPAAAHFECEVFLNAQRKRYRIPVEAQTRREFRMLVPLRSREPTRKWCLRGVALLTCED